MESNLSNRCRTALERLGIPDADLTPVDPSSDAVWRVGVGDDRFCLKLLEAGTAESGLRCQVALMDHLREGDVPVVRTVAPGGGEPFFAVEGDEGERLAILYEWIDGEPIGIAGGGAAPGPGARGRERWMIFHRMGELLARLHSVAAEFVPPAGLDIPTWDDVYAPAPGGWLDAFLERGIVEADGREVIRRAADRTRRLAGSGASSGASSRGRPGYGLIHADFHGGNIIDDGRRLWIVDLDDFGWGHRLFDLTWPAALRARKRGEDSRPRDGFLEAMLEGYERRRPIAAGERALLGDLHLAAGIAAIEMVLSSPVPDDGPLARGWYAFAVAWLESHLEAPPDDASPGHR